MTLVHPKLPIKLKALEPDLTAGPCEKLPLEVNNELFDSLAPISVYSADLGADNREVLVEMAARICEVS